MNKHLLSLALAVTLAPIMNSHAAPPTRRQPNILFLFSDDHAVNAISAYGGRLKDVAPTPSLDRLAAGGMLFTRAFCANSICGPSRACIMTGKHSHVNGFLDNDNSTFDGSQTTLPKLLHNAGYETALIGKWHLVSFPQGFDHVDMLPGQGSYYNPEFIRTDGSTHKMTGYCTDLITDKTLEWLKNGRNPDKPFMLFSWHKAPHRTWAPAPRHMTLFDGVKIPEPTNLFDDYANRSIALRKQAMQLSRNFYWNYDLKMPGESPDRAKFPVAYGFGEYPRANPEQREAWDKHYQAEYRALMEQFNKGMTDEEITRWKYQRYMKDYLSAVRALDEGIGRVLDYLDQSGLAENTLVVYSSDQGFYLGEHGWYDKRWIFEESLAMPLIVRWPGVTSSGARPDQLVQNIDFAPTLLDAAGLPIPETMQGRSLLPILRGESPPAWRDAIYYFYSGEETHAVAAHDGIRTSRYKLVRFPDTSEWNLFDLVKDPDEMHSVHGDPAYAATLAEMQTKYRELRAAYRMSEATLPAPRRNLKIWMDRYNAQTEMAKAGPHDIVLIGDSITQAWEGPGKDALQTHVAPLGSILNLGISGDRTQHVLWRLLNGCFQGQHPKACVVMIGTNNTGHQMQDARETADGIRLIVELLRDRAPQTEIILHPIFPRGAKANDPMRLRNDEINALIRPLADTPRTHWLDFGKQFMDQDGNLNESLMPDLLHLSPAGYDIWARALRSELESLAGNP